MCSAVSSTSSIFAASTGRSAKRFDVVYHLLSPRQNLRVRIKLQVAEDEGVPSATSVYMGADWFEREAWDMYGIPFEGHADLRRILTDYGFEGHPLRKDFPVTGFVEVRYDDVLKRVLYEPVELKQEFRNFDFLSPQEGLTMFSRVTKRPSNERSPRDRARTMSLRRRWLQCQHRRPRIRRLPLLDVPPLVRRDISGCRMR